MVLSNVITSLEQAGACRVDRLTFSQVDQYLYLNSEM